MKPLRTAACLAAVLAALASAASAGPQMEGSGAAPRASVTPQTVGAMADGVTKFFLPQNPDPRPSELTGIVNVLQTVGKQGGPTRAEVQPIIDRIQLAASHFDGFDPLEEKPAYGLASSVQLELLAGPLRAWLSDGQKDLILKKQAEYGSKLNSFERARLSSKMKAWAEALQGAAAPRSEKVAAVDARELGGGDSEKETLWREHSRLTLAAGREIDPHDLFGDAADVMSRPGAFVGPAKGEKASSGGLRAALRRLAEKAGIAAYLSGHVTAEGLETARSVLQPEAPAKASPKAEAFAQRLDDDYFNAHGFYPPASDRKTLEKKALAQPVAPPVSIVLAQASALAGAKPSEDSGFAEYVRQLDQDYYDVHGYYPGEKLIRSSPGRVRDFLIKISPIVAIALLAGLLAAPHGLVILVLASRLGAGAAVVYLARRLRRKAFFDEDFKRPWLAMGLSIPVELLGWGSLISTLAVIAGLLPR